MAKLCDRSLALEKNTYVHRIHISSREVQDVTKNYQWLEVTLFFSWLAESVTTALLNGVNLDGEPPESHKTTSSMVPNCWYGFFYRSPAKLEKTISMW